MPLDGFRESRVLRWENIYLVILLGISVAVQRLLTSGCCNGPDFVTYLDIAQQISQPHFWTTPEAFNENFWAMLYPTFLYLILRLPGATVETIQWIQMIIAATLSVGGWLLVYRQGRMTRLVTATVIALSPTTIWVGNSLGYEVILAWFLTFSLAIAWTINRSTTTVSQPLLLVVAAVAGVLMGFAVLTQSKSIVVLPVIVYLLWKASKRLGIASILGFLLATIPWSVRNLLVLGNPSITTHNSAYNLWIGNSPFATLGGSTMPPEQMPADTETQLSEALNFIVSQPEIAINLVFRKAMRLWEPIFVYPDVIPVGIGRSLLHVLAAMLTILILGGFIAFMGGRLFVSPPAIPDLTPLAVFVVLFYLTHLPFIAEPRFMTAVYPITVAVAISTIVFMRKRQKTVRNIG